MHGYLQIYGAAFFTGAIGGLDDTLGIHGVLRGNLQRRAGEQGARETVDLSCIHIAEFYGNVNTLEKIFILLR